MFKGDRVGDLVLAFPHQRRRGPDQVGTISWWCSAPHRKAGGRCFERVAEVFGAGHRNPTDLVLGRWVDDREAVVARSP